jgi:hypothetical protein
MDPEEVEAALSQLKDPTTAPVLAEALGYRNRGSIVRACIDGRIPGAEKRGGIWLIPIEGVRQAIKDRTLRPGWKQGE